MCLGELQIYKEKQTVKYKLHDYALIAEIMGGFSIVFSLIFVGIQISQNTEIVRAQTRDSLSEKQIDLYLTLGTNKDAIEAYTLGRSGSIQLDLDNPDYVTWQFLAFSNLRIWENEWYQFDKGLFEAQEYESRSQALAVILSKSGYKEIWKDNKTQYSEGFRAYVDSLLAAQEVSSATE